MIMLHYAYGLYCLYSHCNLIFSFISLEITSFTHLFATLRLSGYTSKFLL